MANPLTLETLKPDWGSSLQYIPAIIYGMRGFELVSAGSDEMRDPARDVPRSIFISGAIIIVLYRFGTMAVPALCIVLFMYTPGEGMEWPVLAGVVITLLIGEIVFRFSENHRKR